MPSPFRKESPRGGPTLRPFAGPNGASRSQLARNRILEAMLRESGERGFEHVTVQGVARRAGTSRSTFYAHFTNREDCFVAAYGEAAEWLHERLKRRASEEERWQTAVRATLAELLDFCAREPELARALFVEVHTAGAEAQARHQQLLGRIARELEDSRPDRPEAASALPIRGTFVAGAVETVLCVRLMHGGGQEAPALLPSLLHVVVFPYLGEAAAIDEMTAAPIASWSARRRAAGETA